MSTGTYHLDGRGSDLGLSVAGPDLAACLIAAAEGFAAALTTTPVAATSRAEPVALDEESPADLLVALMDEAIVRLDADGALVVGLEVDEVDGGRLRGRLRLVDLDEVEVHGVAPKAATWHEVRLDPDDGGWSGAVMLDL